MGIIRTFFRRLLTDESPAMLKTGDTAPPFEVEDHHGQTVRLSDFAGKRLVLWFYPKADTPG